MEGNVAGRGGGPGRHHPVLARPPHVHATSLSNPRQPKHTGSTKPHQASPTLPTDTIRSWCFTMATKPPPKKPPPNKRPPNEPPPNKPPPIKPVSPPKEQISRLRVWGRALTVWKVWRQLLAHRSATCRSSLQCARPKPLTSETVSASACGLRWQGRTHPAPAHPDLGRLAALNRTSRT
eukprot:360636-Chlamydomonas_euryale.AAC.1